MSDNIGWTGVAEGQTNKEVTINSALGAIDAAVTENVSVDVSATGDYTFADNSVLTTAVSVSLAGATAAKSIIIAVPFKKFVRFVNPSAFALTLKVGSGTLVIAATKAALVYLDGTANGIAAASSNAAASGVPNGGSTGQVLTKASNADQDANWQTPSGGGGGGGGGIPSAAGVRLSFYAGEGYYAFAMAEVEMLDSTGTVIPWPTGTTFTANSSDGSSPPSNAADGNATTFWATPGFGGAAAASFNYYWAAKFPAGTTLDIASIRITARPVGSGAGAQTPATIGFMLTTDGLDFKFQTQHAYAAGFADGEVRTFTL